LDAAVLAALSPVSYTLKNDIQCKLINANHLADVRNPICLAKLILDKTYKPLSLRRVPPNLLVGEGAKDFAKRNGIAILPNSHLISKNAHDRYKKWEADLRTAEARCKEEQLKTEQLFLRTTSATHKTAFEKYRAEALQGGGNHSQPDHVNAIMTGTWNEGQPDSPYHGTPVDEHPVFDPANQNSSFRLPEARFSTRPPLTRNPLSLMGPLTPPIRNSQSAKPLFVGPRDSGRAGVPSSGSRFSSQVSHEARHDSSVSPLPTTTGPTSPPEPAIRDDGTSITKPRGIKRPFSAPDEEQEDHITDTIGAIAIDGEGRIAAGSSSGGIGIKHRGRVGPAALVGIGSAVVPSDPTDADGVSVAAVTSGTGEHMATTMASQRCAERICFNTRRGPRGQDVHEDDDDAIMESFITMDFMGHPGVKNCNSAGAIGVMVVKKTNKGYYFYFAHNTDSFALASMSGADKAPVCVMSRLREENGISRGGRKISVEW
jgi:taspase, threonine aspartase, 1